MSSIKLSLFSQLIGNWQAKEILQRLLDRTALPTVLLFHGPSGVGKGLFAEELARALVKSTKEQHPDIHTLRPDPESSQHPIATIRHLLNEAVLPPFEAPVKIFVIHDAEKMLATSSNALLKTLEEPPPKTYFILLSSQLEMLLPTIVSRCNKIQFFPVPEEELGPFLIEKFHTQEGQKIAVLAQGSVADAIHRIKNPMSTHLDQLFRSRSYTELREHFSKMEDDIEEPDRLFEEMLFWVREHEPLRLEEAIPLIREARQALYHHVKLKNTLEHFYINFLKL
jgi:DNA polymerase-3 subunit delta'